MKIEDMNKDERSLLLFFETAAVDCGGTIDARHMNETDFKRANRWNEEGFIRFGRIAAHDIRSNKTRWCVLSDEAWTEAHRERRARNLRIESGLNVHRNGYDG